MKQSTTVISNSLKNRRKVTQRKKKMLKGGFNFKINLSLLNFHTILYFLISFPKQKQILVSFVLVHLL